MPLGIPLGTQTEGLSSRDGRTFFITSEAFKMAFLSVKAALQKINLGGFVSRQ